MSKLKSSHQNSSLPGHPGQNRPPFWSHLTICASRYLVVCWIRISNHPHLLLTPPLPPNLNIIFVLLYIQNLCFLCNHVYCVFLSVLLQSKRSESLHIRENCQEHLIRFLSIPACNFQSMNSPVEMNSLLFIETLLLCHLLWWETKLEA